MDDLYYYPEKWGLEIVASIDYSDGDYQFELRIVWRHKDSGKLLTARDGGCSCPTPFEDIHKIEDLEDYSFDRIRAEALEMAREDHYNGDPPQPFIDKLPR